MNSSNNNTMVDELAATIGDGLLSFNTKLLGRILQYSGDNDSHNASGDASMEGVETGSADSLASFFGILLLIFAISVCCGLRARRRVETGTSARQQGQQHRSDGHQSAAHINVNFKSLLLKTTMEVCPKSLVRKEESSQDLTAGDEESSQDLAAGDGTQSSSVVEDLELGGSEATAKAEKKEDQENAHELSKSTTNTTTGTFRRSLSRQGLFPLTLLASTGRSISSQSSLVGTENIVLQLPKDADDSNIRPDRVNAHGRWVPSICAICLNSYKKGDLVSWSNSAACSHAYHTYCIVSYAETCSMKQQEQEHIAGSSTTSKLRITVPCPLCRNTFVDSTVVRNPNSPKNFGTNTNFPISSA